MPSIVQMRVGMIAEEAENFIGVIDKLGQLLYAVYGAGASFGIDLDAAFDMLHASNMSKLCKSEGEAQQCASDYRRQFPNDEITYRKCGDFWAVFNQSKGRVLKAANYRDPDLRPLAAPRKCSMCGSPDVEHMAFSDAGSRLVLCNQCFGRHQMNQRGSGPMSGVGQRNSVGMLPPPMPAGGGSSSGAMPMPPGRGGGPGNASPLSGSPMTGGGGPKPPGVSDMDLQQAQAAFRRYDRDQNGAIDSNELSQVLQDMRLNVNGDGLRFIMKDADRNGNGQIDFSEFMKLLPAIKSGKYNNLSGGGGGGGGAAAGGGGGGGSGAAGGGAGGLPAGWSKAQAPDGRTYYFHKATGKTSWKVPQEAAGGGGGGGGGALPAGWKQATNAQGRTYYYKGNVTQWTRPTA